MDPCKIVYELKFPDGRTKLYQILLNAESFALIPQPASKMPPWTVLEYGQCDHCPLKAAESPECPVAANLSVLVEDFKNEYSDTKVSVRVTTKERIYEKETDLQHAIFSLFGLIMATSACPYMKFLRPMARYHLPFANSEETAVRSISIYLLKQYFVAKDGRSPDLSLQGLEKSYENLQLVNLGLLKRIKSILAHDVDANALIVLHSLATRLTMAIDSNLDKLRPYLQLD